MLRLALVGCGEHSRTSHAVPLARYAANHPGEIDLIAVCDLDAGRAAEFRREFGFARAYTDLDMMLSAEKLNGCVCVMPVSRIVEVSTRILKKEIPCVIEKPLGTNLQQAEELAAFARKTKTPHMVSVNRRFIPFLNHAASMAAERGPLQYVRASMLRHGRIEPEFIWETAVHVVDALRHLNGEIADFNAQVIRSDKLASIWYLLSFSFQNGSLGYIEVLPTTGMVEENYDLFGESSRAKVVTAAGTQQSLQFWQENKLFHDETASLDAPEDLRNGSYEEISVFIESLRNGRNPIPTIEDVLPSLRICSQIAGIIKEFQTS